MNTTTEAFLVKNNLKILEWVNGSEVLVQNKYGICRVRYCNLVNEFVPTIQSSIDKNKYYENMSREIHGNAYDYSKVNYVKAQTNVIITCKKHGDFTIMATSHTSQCKKQGCPICTKELPSKRLIGVENFKIRASIKHNNFYDYSLITEYNGQHTKARIICPLHGEFTQDFKSHLRGGGCYECAKKRISKSRGDEPTGWEYSRWIKASEKSKQFDSYKVYIIKCFDDKEIFIKIGRTYQKVSRRFRTREMLPYNFEILHEFVDSGINICKLESELKASCKDYKYKPLKSFNGSCECYTEESLKQISAIPR